MTIYHLGKAETYVLKRYNYNYNLQNAWTSNVS